MHPGLIRAVAALFALYAAAAHAAEPTRAVKAVGPARIAIGEAMIPLYLSQDWSKPLPGVTRAVLMLHGRLRNADTYYHTAQAALRAKGAPPRETLLIAPQFLTRADIAVNALPPDMLFWRGEGWEGGDPAEGPSDASSFEALDAVLAKLADKRFFPALRTVVIAGHSGGAQVVQRYAIAGKAEANLAAAGIAMRYVVANPSSYAYFDAARPIPPVPGSCPRYNDWKYGMDHRPPYLIASSPRALETAYVQRDVTYLVGSLDRNPAHPALDRTCMAEAEGLTRYDRAYDYYASLRNRDAGLLRHRLVEVPGVGHDGDAMFTSQAGLDALFGATVTARP